MSTLSYHFPEFAFGAVRARPRRCHPLRIGSVVSWQR